MLQIRLYKTGVPKTERAEIKFDESPYNLSSRGIQGCTVKLSRHKIGNIFYV